MHAAGWARRRRPWYADTELLLRVPWSRSSALRGHGEWLVEAVTRALGAVLFLCGLIAASSSDARAQSENQRRFEVAAIRPHVDDGTSASGYSDNQGSVRMTNLSLRALIRIAYGVMDSQIEAPAWTATDSWDIVAKPPAAYESRQLPELLRNLLAERFKLVVHRQRKDVAGYALRVQPGGHRLPEARGPQTYFTGRSGLISSNRRTIAELVPALARMVSAPVVNETALTGQYDFKLEWDAEVSIFTAIREQMGLRLEPVRVPVDVVVVDAAARTPTEN
jgi:uncharacterized protein (TIGR03435 family)